MRERETIQKAVQSFSIENVSSESFSVGKILAFWLSKNAEIIVDTQFFPLKPHKSHATLSKNMT